MEGVTSLGRDIRPACNQGLLEISLNKRNMILTSIQCVFMDFRFHRHVTSGDVIPPPSPCEGSGNTLGGSCLRSRIYPTPCFFESMATHLRGLGRSLRFTHAQTNSVHVCAFLWMRVFFTPCPESRSLIGRNGQVNKLMTYPMLMSHTPKKDNSPLSFPRSDWLLPSLAMLTTHT